MTDAESFTHPYDSNVRKSNAEAKDIMKCYADKRLQAEAKPIDVGDTVLVKKTRLNKLSRPLNPTPLVVMERKEPWSPPYEVIGPRQPEIFTCSAAFCSADPRG